MILLRDSYDPSSIDRRANVDGERQEADLKHDPCFLELRPVHWVLGKKIR